MSGGICCKYTRGADGMPYLREWMSPDFGSDSGTTLGRQTALGHVQLWVQTPGTVGPRFPGYLCTRNSGPKYGPMFFALIFQ